jgi:cysteine synthase A
VAVVGDALVVLGASISQRTLIEAARGRGLRVCAVDGSSGAPGLALADVPIAHDFSDTAGVLAALREHDVRPLGVASMGSDLAVAPASRLAAALGLPGLPAPVALAATDKRAMREAFVGAGVASPPAAETRSREEVRAAYADLGPAVVVKPADGSAQRGVTAVHAADALDAADARARAASRSGRVIVERYVDGDEFTVNGFVAAGLYTPVTLTRRVLHDPPPLGVCLAHRFPAGLETTSSTALVAAAEAATLALGIDDAPSYAQLRLGPEGPAVIEVGARLGGGKDAELARLVTGVDLVGAVIDAALGRLSPASLDPAAPVDACGQVAFLVEEAGRVVTLDEEAALTLPGVHEVGWYFAEGQDLPPLRSGADRLGYVIVTAPTPAELDARTAAARSALTIAIEPGAGSPAAP